MAPLMGFQSANVYWAPGPPFPVQSSSAAVTESRGEHQMCSIPPQLTPQPPSPLQAPHLFRTQAVSIMGWAQRHSPCPPSCFQWRHSLTHVSYSVICSQQQYRRQTRRAISTVQQFHSRRIYCLHKLKAWSEHEMEAINPQVPSGPLIHLSAPTRLPWG